MVEVELQESQVGTAAQAAAVVVVQALAEDQQAHRVKVITAALAQPILQLMQTAAAVAALVQVAALLAQVAVVTVAQEALHLLLEHQSLEVAAVAAQELEQTEAVAQAVAVQVTKQILQQIQELLIQAAVAALKTAQAALVGRVLAVQAALAL